MHDQPGAGKTDKEKEEEKKKGFVPSAGSPAAPGNQGAIGAASGASGSAGAASGSAGMASGSADLVSGAAGRAVFGAAKIAASAGGRGLLSAKGAFALAAGLVCAVGVAKIFLSDNIGSGTAAFSSGTIPGQRGSAAPRAVEPQASASSLEMFKDTNKGFIGGEKAASAEGGGAKDASGGEQAEAGAPADGSAAGEAGAEAASGAAPEAGRLQAAGGFGGVPGGGRSAAGGVPGGGAGQPSANVPASAQGAASSMKNTLLPVAGGGAANKASGAAKKGAFGQSKFASAKSGAAAKSVYEAARTGAGQAFGGDSAGAGITGSPVGGAGLSGGVSDGPGLKAGEPSLNKSNFTPPPVGEPEDVSPWKKYKDMMMYAILAWAALYYIALAMGKSAVPWIKGAAKLVAMLAAAAAAAVIYAGYKLVSEFGQQLMGYMGMFLGGFMAFMAIKAALGEGKEKGAEKEAIDKTQESNPGQLLQQQMQQLLKEDEGENGKKKK